MLVTWKYEVMKLVFYMFMNLGENVDGIISIFKMYRVWINSLTFVSMKLTGAVFPVCLLYFVWHWEFGWSENDFFYGFFNYFFLQLYGIICCLLLLKNIFFLSKWPKFIWASNLITSTMPLIIVAVFLFWVCFGLIHTVTTIIFKTLVSEIWLHPM